MGEKRTPTPWVVRETVMHGTRYGGLWIEPEDAEYLVPLSGSGGAKSYTSRIVDIQDHDHNDANARFIVRAVNAHDDLVEALKAAAASAGFQYMLPEVREKIDAALSRHGEGK